VSSYASIVPSTHASGGIERHGNITKQGSRWLCWVIVEAAHSHLKYDIEILQTAF